MAPQLGLERGPTSSETRFGKRSNPWHRTAVPYSQIQPLMSRNESKKGDGCARLSDSNDEQQRSGLI